jgi:poly(glycerol-phosphate) alpha-glucosyltransferase
MDGDKGSIREQFAQEAEALKQIIYQFIDSGHVLMAAQVFEQYSLINPDDPDIEDLRAVLFPGGTEINEGGIPEEYKILENIETVFIMSTVLTKRTGYIDSVLRKIRLMEEKWNYKPLLLTCIHNIDLRKAQAWLASATAGQVALDANTKTLNVYEYFQNSYAEGLENRAVFSDAQNDLEENLEGLEIKKLYTGYLGSLRKVRYFKDGNAVRDMVYDDWGYLNCIYEYSPLSEDVYDAKYFTTDGKLCIEELTRIANDGTEQKKIFLYDENGEVLAECDDDAGLAAICLERIMVDDKFYMLVVEAGLMSKAATMIQRKENVAKCIMVHSIFLNDAYNPKSGPQKYYRYLCENHEMFDGIIMLTEEERRDFLDIYGSNASFCDPEKLFVISHPYPHEICKTEFDKRDTLKAVVVSRLDPIKQVDLTIEIFARAIRELPKARLEIYGHGPEEENLKKLIRRLGMEDNIFLMGYTDEPLAAFNSAALSIFTSKAEGFGLTLMESICNGCPAFAFDIKYGPAEIIDDGETGFLFKRGDIRTFARMIYEYFMDEQMQRAMSENGYAAALRFSNDKFLDNWYKMTLKLAAKAGSIGSDIIGGDTIG